MPTEDYRQPNTVPGSQAGDRQQLISSESGKPPVAQRAGGDRNQLSRALRAKEENKQHSLALMKATAEATLTTNNNLS